MKKSIAVIRGDGIGPEIVGEAIRVLDGVEDIQICRLTPADVVRHVLVQRIVAAYDKYEKNRLPDERARTFTKKPDWKREKK